jgi:hypothetical protein
MDQNPKCPPVHTLPVALIQQDLWGDILRRSAQRVGFKLDVLCKPEIGDLEIS